MNVPRTIGAVISSGLASMVDIQNELGMEDIYDLLEIITIDAYNKRIAEKSEG